MLSIFLVQRQDIGLVRRRLCLIRFLIRLLLMGTVCRLDDTGTALGGSKCGVCCLCAGVAVIRFAQLAVNGGADSNTGSISYSVRQLGRWALFVHFLKI